MKAQQLTHEHIVEKLQHIEHQFEMARLRHIDRQSTMRTAIAQAQTAAEVIRLSLQLEREQVRYEEFERSFQEQKARVVEWI